MIIEYLEKIGDSYRDICRYVSQNKIKINKPLIEIFSDINFLLKDTYKLFYDFNLIDMERFLIRKDNIEKKIFNLAKSPNKNDALLLIHLNIIMNNIFYLNGPLMINAL